MLFLPQKFDQKVIVINHFSHHLDLDLLLLTGLLELDLYLLLCLQLTDTDLLSLSDDFLSLLRSEVFASFLMCLSVMMEFEEIFYLDTLNKRKSVNGKKGGSNNLQLSLRSHHDT